MDAITGTKPRGKSQALKQEKIVTPDSIILALVNAPQKIRDAQWELDQARAELEERQVDLSIEALKEKRFIDPKTGELAVASNDQQRKLAIDAALAEDVDYNRLLTDFETAQRELAFHKNTQENYRVIAELLIGKQR